MKLSCWQEELAQGLKIVKRAVASRSPIPILHNVKLEAKDGRLELFATNLEIGIECTIIAQVEEEGAITVPALTFAELIDTLPRDVVNISLKESSQTLQVECQGQKANVKGIEAEEFPVAAEFGTEGVFELPADIFCRMIKRASIAAGDGKIRPVLAGILVELVKGQLSLVAADGFRLSICNTEVSEEREAIVIVPARSLMELTKIGLDIDFIQVDVHENRVLFQAGDTKLVCQVINGEFPDYRKMYSSGYTTRAVVNTDDFKRACTMTKVFAKEVADVATVEVSSALRQLTISALSPERGDSAAEVETEVEGEDITIGLNAIYLLDVLRVIESEQVAMEATSPLSAVTIKPLDDSDFSYIVMPMTIS